MFPSISILCIIITLIVCTTILIAIRGLSSHRARAEVAVIEAEARVRDRLADKRAAADAERVEKVVEWAATTIPFLLDSMKKSDPPPAVILGGREFALDAAIVMLADRFDGHERRLYRIESADRRAGPARGSDCPGCDGQGCAGPDDPALDDDDANIH